MTTNQYVERKYSKNGEMRVEHNRYVCYHRARNLNECDGACSYIVSDEGVLLRVNRSIQVEGAFGVLKQDYAFRRFLFRGKRNIEMQFFLLAFAFNIQKLCNRIQNHRVLSDLFQISSAA